MLLPQRPARHLRRRERPGRRHHLVRGADALGAGHLVDAGADAQSAVALRHGDGVHVAPGPLLRQHLAVPLVALPRGAVVAAASPQGLAAHDVAHHLPVGAELRHGLAQHLVLLGTPLVPRIHAAPTTPAAAPAPAAVQHGVAGRRRDDPGPRRHRVLLDAGQRAVHVVVVVHRRQAPPLAARGRRGLRLVRRDDLGVGGGHGATGGLRLPRRDHGRGDGTAVDGLDAW